MQTLRLVAVEVGHDPIHTHGYLLSELPPRIAAIKSKATITMMKKAGAPWCINFS